MFTAMIIVVFGQMRFDRTNRYSAEFTNVSGLRAGPVRPRLGRGGRQGRQASSWSTAATGCRSNFNVDRSLPLYQSTTASDPLPRPDRRPLPGAQARRGEGPTSVLPPGATIPLARTSPALDIDALIGGFRPLFRALDPDQVNALSRSTVADLPGAGRDAGRRCSSQTSILTSTLAGRSELIGQLITQPEHRAAHHGQAPARSSTRPSTTSRC